MISSRKSLSWPEWTRYEEGIRLSLFSSEDFLDRWKKTEFQKEDVVVTAHPRTGGHWFGELTWLIVNNADVNKAKESYMDKRTRFIETDLATDTMNSTDWFATQKPPRVMKTHLQPEALKNKMQLANFKVIAIFRNPKDMLVSYYLAAKEFMEVGFSWEEFLQLVKDDKLWMHSVFTLNSKWWNEAKTNPNILCVHYEKMKANPECQIKRIAEHLDKVLSKEQVRDILEYATVDNMRENYPKELRSLIKEGKVGGRVKYFTPEQEAWVDEKMKQVEEECGLKWM